ncbi:DEAD/DEAH box helicase [Treponema phagedenis]|uniref:DEAD/DEAH box helicase n=2 Tax=Treponema phagedenis TaxID=162 RepID=UPI0011F00BD9|nr:DEAD/DEAH box helicase [Treponema phagedenis]TYT78113.1 DEAD/DEAH box helicase [Treponema phagedenis]
MKFTELNLDLSLQQGINDAGYEECTPVQKEVLEKAFSNADLYVQSQTGTGKTAAYLIPILQRMLSEPAAQKKTALIMVPTRELAVQIEEECAKLAKHTGITAASFYGGVGYEKQTKSLKEGAQILIGTPGRVIDLQKSGTMKLDTVGFLVVDEADRMFDMGFYPDLRTLLQVLPKAEKRQTMLFSATLNTWVKNLAWEYTENAQEISIDSDVITVEEIDQKVFHVSSDAKMQLLLGILAREKPENLIIFCNTKKSVEIVAKRLGVNNHICEFLNGDLPQHTRQAIINKFKTGKINCVVATDVAARGIDINNLEMVINYDLPNESENYVHRIGRTARAGKSGKAYSLCSEKDAYNLPEIEKFIEAQIPAEVPEASLFIEDKSSSMYIRLGTEKPHRPRKNNVAELRPRKGRKDKKKKPFSEGKKERPTKQPKGKNKNEQELLEQMAFEDRMKYYQSKYAKNEGAENTWKKENPKTQKRKSASKKKQTLETPPKKQRAKQKTQADVPKKTANLYALEGKIIEEGKQQGGKLKSFFRSLFGK